MSTSPVPAPRLPDGSRWREIFSAGGDAGARIAEHDWSATPLGPVTSWPQSLRTAVTICLHSRFPMLLMWGPDLVMLYNDAFQPVLGVSKREALGRPGAQVWAEVWDVVGPMLEGVLAGQGATWSQDQQLLLDRNGYVEECYFTFSYSPIIDESGRPGGVLATVSETTDRVIGERRMRVLANLATSLVDAGEPTEVARRTVKTVTESVAVPLARLYLVDGEGLRLAAAGGGAPPTGAEESWSLAEVLASGTARVCPLDPAGDPRRPGTSAVVVTPVPDPGGHPATGVLVAGLNPRRPVDEGYLSFVELLAGHVGTALAAARAHQEERRRAAARAELDAAKTVFFANVSHELRTPLTLIAGPVHDALNDRDHPLSEPHLRRLHLVDRNTGRLRRLVDSVLDFTRIEANRMVPDRVAVDLSRLTREIAASFAPAVERAGLAFEVACTPLPRPAWVDRSMWEKVVLNLLSNALKATLDGGIRLTLTDDGSGVRLSVRDTGVGIPADQLPELFQRFHRVSGRTGRSAEGTGLGLALVRELVRLHDGDIGVTSAPGEGTTFTVTLPYGGGDGVVAPVTAAPVDVRAYVGEAGGRAPAGPVGVPGAPRVLLVDDNADLRGYVTELLSGQFRVETAPDGRAALAAITRDPPDLVLADVMMPHLDGFGLLSAIRARPAVAHLPVVLLSARVGPDAAVEGLAAGADDYLVKPFSGTELLARVRANLDRARDRLRRGSWATELLQSMGDGIWVADDRGVVFQVNDRFAALTGFGPDEAPYVAPYPWWPDPRTHPAERALLDEALVHLLDRGTGTFEVPFRHRDGRIVWVSVSATTVWDPDRERHLLVGTARDVTADRAVAERQRAAAALVEELATAGDTDEILAVAGRALESAFGGTAHLARWDTDDAPRVHPGGPVDPLVAARLAETHRDGAAEPAGEVDGLGARTGTPTQEWSLWVAFPAPRVVRQEEHLLVGLLATAIGQALRRVETVARQDAVTEDLRGAVREATERERAWRAEAAARADQQRADHRFRTLVEASTAVIWTADASGRFTEPQPSWEAYTGQRWPEQAGAGWAAMLHPGDRERVEESWHESLAAGAPLFETEGRLWHAASGGYRHFAVRAACLRDAGGAVTEWIGTIYDTHDRVVAEDAAKRTAAISDALLTTAPVGVGWVDTDLRYRYVNPALAAMNRASVEEHHGRRPVDVLPGPLGVRIEELLHRSMADGPVTGVQFTTPETDATVRPGHLVASYFPIRIAGTEETVGVGFTIVDVTERLRLLEALGEERARHERLAATDVLAVFGGEGARITEANEAFLAMLGYTAEDVAAGRLTWPQLTPPGWERADERALVELRETGRATAYDKEYLHRDGHRVPVLIGVVALEREPLRWLAYAADLSAERAAQAELRLFQALVERSGDFIAVASPDGRAVYVNPAGREFVGMAADDRVEDVRLLDFAAPQMREVWRTELIPTALREGHHRVETRLARLDTGEQLDVDHQTFAVTTGDGRDTTAFVATVARDINDRQRALRQAKALARLAGALSTARGRPAVVEAVTTTAPAVFDGARVRVATVDPGAVRVRVSDGSTTDQLTLDEDVPVTRAIRDNAAVPVPGADGTVGALCLPLRYGDGRTLGAVEVRWDRPVTDDDALRNLLDTVAGLCSQALQRAELARSAQAMADFAARLSVTRTTREAIDVILTAAPVALHAVAPGLAVREAGRQVRLYHPELPAALAAGYDDLTSVDDPRPIAYALRTGERIILHDRAEFVARFPGLSDLAGAKGLVTTVALPLLDAQRRPIAALGFGWPRARRFRDGDLALLDTIADLCEQTLERVRLAAAEHNLVTRLAGRLRTSAGPAPAALDIAVRYEPAVTGLNLGGDWYDLIPLDGGRLAVVVGDVVGHRVEAAADMAQLRTMVNTLIRLGVPLGEVFPRLTDLVGRGFLGTCLAMVVDPAAGELTVARAGHPHPVLLRPGSEPVTVETVNSLPLGMVRQPMTVTTVPFTRGDLVMAYTDGLVERRDQPYDAGVEALHAVLAAHRDEPVEGVADAVLTGLAESEDDQALVVIRHVG